MWGIQARRDEGRGWRTSVPVSGVALLSNFLHSYVVVEFCYRSISASFGLRVQTMVIGLVSTKLCGNICGRSLVGLEILLLGGIAFPTVPHNWMFLVFRSANQGNSCHLSTLMRTDHMNVMFQVSASWFWLCW